MKKISSLGKVLSRDEAKKINGGYDPRSDTKCNNTCMHNTDCDMHCPSCEVGDLDGKKRCV